MLWYFCARVMLVNLSDAIMQVTVSVTIIQHLCRCSDIIRGFLGHRFQQQVWGQKSTETEKDSRDL